MKKNQEFCCDELAGIKIKCPKCKSEDVVVGMEEIGKYFWVSQCNKCGYKENEK